MADVQLLLLLLLLLLLTQLTQELEPARALLEIERRRF